MGIMPLEADTRFQIDKNLENLGWKFGGQQRNVFFEQPRSEIELKRLKGKRPDYVLYSKETDKPIIIIEAKRKGEKIDKALKQGIEYAKALDATLVYATDGLFCKSYHTKYDKTPILNGEEVDEFLRETLALKYLDTWEVNTVSPKVQYDRKELIKIFDEANNMLRGDGLRAGIERFGEFANILFLKLISESEDIKKLGGIQSEFDDMCHWNYIKNLKTSSRVEHINKIVYEKLNTLYKTDIFTPLSIRDTSILKEIMDELDPLTLTDVDSDVKGDAFEYFLKESTATKNDLGEYFTPRHIVKTMVKLVNPQFGEKVYDPFCGTGGFLIESFRHIWNTMPRNDKNIKLLQEKTIYGNEITNTARITKMNMILAGDGHSNIHMKDSLANPVEGEYDVVLANMPYSQKTKHGNLYDLPSANGDSICVQHCMKAINATSENGRMAIVVPEGFLFRKDLEKTRELILKNCNLQSIISLPQGVFLPYTGVKTNIIYATKVNQKLSSKEKSKYYWYFEVKSDGYTLDNHRRKLESDNDLDKYQEYRKFDKDQQQEMLDIGFEVIPFDKVKENSYVLVGSRYRKQNIQSQYDIKSFNEIAILTRGVTYSKSQESTTETTKIILPADNIDLFGMLSEKKPIYLKDDFNLSEEKRLKKNDIFICMSSGSKEHIGKVAFVNHDTMYYAGGFMGIIRTNPNTCISKYLNYYLLKSKKYREEIVRLTQGANINNLGSSIDNIQIPLPQIQIQQQIVDELDNYQRIIDGARAITESYHPTVRIDKKWSTKSIGELCNLATGSTPSTKDRDNFMDGNIKWLVSGDIHKGIICDCDGRVTEKGKEVARLKLHKENSVLIALNGQGKTRGTVAFLKMEATCNQSLVSMYPQNKDELSSEYLYYVLKGMYQEIRNITGDKQRSGLNMPIIKGIMIPVPSLEIQKQIVSQIQEEQKLIEPSKQLIEVFTRKIQERIDGLFK